MPPPLEMSHVRLVVGGAGEDCLASHGACLRQTWAHALLLYLRPLSFRMAGIGTREGKKASLFPRGVARGAVEATIPPGMG